MDAQQQTAQVLEDNGLEVPAQRIKRDLQQKIRQANQRAQLARSKPRPKVRRGQLGMPGHPGDGSLDEPEEWFAED